LFTVDSNRLNSVSWKTQCAKGKKTHPTYTHNSQRNVEVIENHRVASEKVSTRTNQKNKINTNKKNKKIKERTGELVSE